MSYSYIYDPSWGGGNYNSNRKANEGDRLMSLQDEVVQRE